MCFQAAEEDMKNIILRVFKQFEIDWNRDACVPSKAYEYFSLHPPSERAFRAMLLNYEDVCMVNKKMFLALKPTEDRKVFPLVALQSEREWHKLSIYVLLAKLDDDSHLRSMALRYESPEGMSGVECQPSTHGFYHVQMCRKFRGVKRFVAPSWVPDSQPSVPLDAEDTVSLILCLLVSLYGSREVKKALPDEDLREHLEKLRALRPPNTCADSCSDAV